VVKEGNGADQENGIHQKDDVLEPDFFELFLGYEKERREGKRQGGGINQYKCFLVRII
jgi:hypothetical protein